MKITLEPKQAALLKGFLHQLDGFKLQQNVRKALRAFHNSVDAKTGIVQVESWRFRQAMPFVKWCFNQAQLGFNKSYGITKIEWYKWLLLPWALGEYFIFVVPFMRRKQWEMAQVAAAVTQVDEAVTRSEGAKQ